MYRKNFIFLISTFLLLPQLAFATEDIGAINASHFGYLTLLPPLIAIILAFITKNVVVSLFTGVFSGCLMLSLGNNNLLSAFTNAFQKFVVESLNSLADPWNAGIILQVLTIGGLIALISKLGGARAVAQALAKRAKTAKSAQLITWALGLFIFFDDYANSLIVGPIMRPVCDNQKISREKLAFIVDATAAPVAGIMIISTWIGYELSVIKQGYAIIGETVNPFSIFVQTIPFRFYNILMLIFIVFTAILLREFGPMYTAQKRAKKEGKLLRDGAIPMVGDDMDELNPKDNVKLSIWNALIPIGTLICAALSGFYFNGRTTILNGEDQVLISLLQTTPFSGDAIIQAFGCSDASIVLFQAALIASIVTIIMGLFQKAWTLQESIELWVTGMKSLLITGVILILAWSLSSVIQEIGTAYFLKDNLSDTIPKILLPSIIFIFGCIISFSTGTSYGTMGILMPLAIPFAHAASGGDHNFILITISAVLSGAIVGDHCSPISDTTILSSMGAACDHLDHVKTQLVYALTVGTLSAVSYIPLAAGLPIHIVMPVAISIMFLIVRFIGKPINEA